MQERERLEKISRTVSGEAAPRQYGPDPLDRLKIIRTEETANQEQQARKDAEATRQRLAQEADAIEDFLDSTFEKMDTAQRKFDALQSARDDIAARTVEGRFDLQAQLNGLLTTQERHEARIHAVAETNLRIEELRAKAAAAVTEEARKRYEQEIKLEQAYRRGQRPARIQAAARGAAWRWQAALLSAKS